MATNQRFQPKYRLRQKAHFDRVFRSRRSAADNVIVACVHNFHLRQTGLREEAMELLIDKISKSKDNEEFLRMMQSPG